MSDQSLKHLDQHSSDNDIVSSITINMDKQGDLNYDIDWVRTPLGQKSIAGILYMLIEENLGEHMFKELKTTLNKADPASIKDVEEVEKLLMKLLANNDNSSVGNPDLVVPPDVIIHI
jgi:hypothetical protein